MAKRNEGTRRKAARPSPTGRAKTSLGRALGADEERGGDRAAARGKETSRGVSGEGDRSRMAVKWKGEKPRGAPKNGESPAGRYCNRHVVLGRSAARRDRPPDLPHHHHVHSNCLRYLLHATRTYIT